MFFILKKSLFNIIKTGLSYMTQLSLLTVIFNVLTSLKLPLYIV